MDSYYDNIENEPLSLDGPIDWYYDKVAEHGYATECVFSIFSEYVCRHNLILKMWSVSFDDLKPEIESDKLGLEIIESDSCSNYVQIKLHDIPEMPIVCSLRVKFDCNFYFSSWAMDSNGNLKELDYSDDYEMK